MICSWIFALISLLIFPYVLIWSHVSGSPYIPTASRQFLKNLAFKNKHATPQPVRAGDGAQKSTLQQRFAELEKDSGLATKSEGRNQSEKKNRTKLTKLFPWTSCFWMKAISCCEDDSSSSRVATVNIFSIPLCDKYTLSPKVGALSDGT